MKLILKGYRHMNTRTQLSLRTLTAVLSTAFVLTLLSACGGGGTNVSSNGAGAIGSTALSTTTKSSSTTTLSTPKLTLPSSSLMLASSSSATKSSTPNPATLAGVSGVANPTGSVTYSSSNAAVASVDANGNISPLKAGSTTITAQYAGDTHYAAASTTTSVTVVQTTRTTQVLANSAPDSGMVTFQGSSTINLSSLTTTLTVPAKPASGVGTVFLWPGIEPNSAASNYLPINTGVLQPVLTWGSSCAPVTQPTVYSTWWISAQYVNTSGTVSGLTGCTTGSEMSVNVGDTLNISMTVSGNVWTQTVTDVQTGKSVSFQTNLTGQAQNTALFTAEILNSALAPKTTLFTNTTLTYTNPGSTLYDICVPVSVRSNDTVSAPTISSNGTKCSYAQILITGTGN